MYKIVKWIAEQILKKATQIDHLGLSKISFCRHCFTFLQKNMGYEHNLWWQLMIAFAVNKKNFLINECEKKMPLTQ